MQRHAVTIRRALPLLGPGPRSLRLPVSIVTLAPALVLFAVACGSPAREVSASSKKLSTTKQAGALQTQAVDPLLMRGLTLAESIRHGANAVPIMTQPTTSAGKATEVGDSLGQFFIASLANSHELLYMLPTQSGQREGTATVWKQRLQPL